MTKHNKNSNKLKNSNVYDSLKNMQVQAPIQKKEPLNISRVLHDVKSNSDLKTTEDKVNYLRQYPNIAHDYPKFYELMTKFDLNDDSIPDVRIMNLMLQKSQDIKEKKIDKLDGEKEVGTLLAQTYIYPHLDKD